MSGNITVKVKKCVLEQVFPTKQEPILRTERSEC